ncbi:hypothetical protein ACQKJC_11710 [Priestia koreensis]|uniref:hypothetical protein n=1 Tax=Priestia koreensis TaxID=284581 RepID=UPI003D08B49D
MKKILVLLVLVLLAACSNSNQEAIKADKKEKKQEERVLTTEEKKYIELIKNGQYGDVTSACIGFENDIQKNYYNIAVAFKSYSETENENFKNDPRKGESHYSSILDSLEKTSYIPKDLKSEVDKLKSNVKDQLESYTEKSDVYSRSTDSKGHRYVIIGMTEEEVLDILGKPQDINPTITSSGTSEQWVYPNGYIYLEDGIVDAIQD